MTTTTLKTVANPDARLIDLGALLDLAIECEKKMFALVDRLPEIAPDHQSAIYSGFISPADGLINAILETEPRTLDGWMVHARAIHHREGDDLKLAA
ncbi:MAG: hypothetical protein F2813_00290 [Actinobacteria bacterium]|uniref:Unannotated protein n=1 Tax=freshwater metagenome TaxID=449393 RepID=A0A6J5YYX1_9ZZZZ|nr:hypothetical protein [Actinomycetota bacterium]